MNKHSLEKWLETTNCVEVQMPNEIFEDLSKAEFKSFNHKCFAYAYYYLTCYIYRNALYGGETDQYSQHNIINVFTSDKSSVSYITKSEGIMDSMNYTKTTTDYPISYYMDNDILEFGLIKELRKKMPDLEMNHSPRFYAKEPIKGMTRFDGEDYTGTFYSFQNTHKIDVRNFIEIISDKKLGHVGLYIYGYISMMCDKFSKYRITNEELAKMVGCSERTIKSYMVKLEKIGVIQSTKITLNNKTQKFYSL
ncbi:winged helix-turn-helix transcriptional regulator [Paenibacillus lautus]|uniref:winged helix-turn-helix transcriptional regulator n=1 Tax=Paenibacillus lautus TaxID=1401 RepID=UPI003D291237